MKKKKKGRKKKERKKRKGRSGGNVLNGKLDGKLASKGGKRKR